MTKLSAAKLARRAFVLLISRLPHKGALVIVAARYESSARDTTETIITSVTDERLILSGGGEKVELCARFGVWQDDCSSQRRVTNTGRNHPSSGPLVAADGSPFDSNFSLSLELCTSRATLLNQVELLGPFRSGFGRLSCSSQPKIDIAKTDPSPTQRQIRPLAKALASNLISFPPTTMNGSHNNIANQMSAACFAAQSARSGSSWRK